MSICLSTHLGEIEGFIDSQEFDVCLIVGDFNVDFSRGGSLKDMLCCFMSGFSLFACDLLYNVDHPPTREMTGWYVHGLTIFFVHNLFLTLLLRYIHCGLAVISLIIILFALIFSLTARLLLILPLLLIFLIPIAFFGLRHLLLILKTIKTLLVNVLVLFLLIY